MPMSHVTFGHDLGRKDCYPSLVDAEPEPARVYVIASCGIEAEACLDDDAYVFPIQP